MMTLINYSTRSHLQKVTARCFIKILDSKYSMHYQTSVCAVLLLSVSLNSLGLVGSEIVHVQNLLSHGRSHVQEISTDIF